MNKIFTEDLSKTFITDGIKNSVLRNINFSMSQGETCSIIGTSGCGKSTFLHLLAKLDDYSSGSIFFNKINYSDLNSNSSASLRLDNFGFVYQFHHLLEDFNAFDNCKIVQDLNNNKNNPNIDELLISVGLKDKFKSYPYQLSGGEKQRLAIARALSNNPNFLIMDEPTGNLDNKTSKLIQELILEISHKRNIGIILATHDLNFANMMDAVYEIFDGGLRKINE
jgi:lipoprotein-releasing system ATP-binding protein